MGLICWSRWITLIGVVRLARRAGGSGWSGLWAVCPRRVRQVVMAGQRGCCSGAPMLIWPLGLVRLIWWILLIGLVRRSWWVWLVGALGGLPAPGSAGGDGGSAWLLLRCADAESADPVDPGRAGGSGGVG
ncbi:hypothetical protein [Streptomyces sp. NPDC001508]|uniref:hypothetical protein n=1 Tax=Streptomyces sp. NPDC001508 TaxID=3154656 RepID=UPI00331EC657